MSWSVTGTLASLVAALAAGIYTWLTYRLVSSQSEPRVVVYAHHDESRPTLIQIVIKNIGHGLATDVSFVTSQPIQKGYGVSVTEAVVESVITEGPLVTGIPVLAPGEQRRITWGQFGGLSKIIGKGQIVVRCQYKHGSKQMPESVSALEVASFEGTDASESEGRRLIGEVKRLADAAEAIKRNFGS